MDDTPDEGERVREEVISRFLKSVSDWVGGTGDVAVRAITIMPSAVDARSGKGKTITPIIGRIGEIQSASVPQSRSRHMYACYDHIHTLRSSDR